MAIPHHHLVMYKYSTRLINLWDFYSVMVVVLIMVVIWKQIVSEKVEDILKCWVHITSSQETLLTELIFINSVSLIIVRNEHLT